MKKITLGMIVLFSVVFASPLMSQTKKAFEKPKGGSCNPCHAVLSTVLSKDHKPVAGNTIQACFPCHKPDFSGEPKPNSFSTRIHRPHVKAEPGIDCLLCHTWVPGKQFSLKSMRGGLGPVSKGNMALAKKSFASWASSGYLDASHEKGNVVCLGCHGKTLPGAGDTVENDRCLACHGSMETLAAKSAPKDFPDRNPHKSHLGDIACTVCHHAHKASEVYCLGCHVKFTIKIPVGGQR